MTLTLSGLKLSNIEKRTFKEFIEFHLSQNEKIGYPLVFKHLGMSKQQWDEFRLNNSELADNFISF